MQGSNSDCDGDDGGDEDDGGMMKRLDDLQRSVDSICGASQKGVVWQKKACNLTTNSQQTLLLTLKPLQHFTDFG